MGDINIKFEGLPALLSEFAALKSRINNATQDATTKTGQRLRHSAILNFHGSHPPGYHHVGGDAPNVVSGHLAWSIVAPPAVNTGRARYSTRVGPTAVYSRVIELGAYITPRDAKFLSWFDAQMGVRRYVKSVTIPPRPYFTPARMALPPQAEQIYRTAWTGAWIA